MKPKHYWLRKQNLDILFDKAKLLPSDFEILAHFAKYLCVLTCGLLETAVHDIYRDYARKRTNPEIANYVSAQLGRFQSPLMENIITLTQQFSENWATTLQNATNGELKDAVNSIVKNRHRIAHGESCHITIERVKRYYEKVVEVIKLLEKQCI